MSQNIRSPLEVPKTLEELNDSHRELTLTRRIADRTLKFLRVIDMLMGGVTLAVQAHPEVSSIVVGVIRVVIDVRYYFPMSQILQKPSAYQGQGGCQILRVL